MSLRFLVQVEFDLFVYLTRDFVSTPETADQGQPSRQHDATPGFEGLSLLRTEDALHRERELLPARRLRRQPLSSRLRVSVYTRARRLFSDAVIDGLARRRAAPDGEAPGTASPGSRRGRRCEICRRRRMLTPLLSEVKRKDRSGGLD